MDCSGDSLVTSMLGSTLDTLSAPVLAFRRISNNFYVDVDSVRYVSLFSRRIEKVLSRCFAHLEICTLFLRRFVADWWFDGDGHFCCIFAAFFGLLFGVEPPGRCTGTGPCIICLSDLHRHGAFVAMHIPSRNAVSKNNNNHNNHNETEMLCQHRDHISLIVTKTTTTTTTTTTRRHLSQL